MTASQYHGFIGQNLFSQVFGNSNPTGKIDFPCDPITGLPVHFKMKAKNCKQIAMSKLGAFVSLLANHDDPFLLATVSWIQQGPNKAISHLDLYQFEPKTIRNYILGDFTLANALYLESEISLNKIHDPEEARAHAKKERKKFNNHGVLRLDPKIDHTYKQRRWQCSLLEQDLQNDNFRWTRYSDRFRDLNLSSLIISSQPRIRLVKSK